MKYNRIISGYQGFFAEVLYFSVGYYYREFSHMHFFSRLLGPQVCAVEADIAKDVRSWHCITSGTLSVCQGFYSKFDIILFLPRVQC